MKRSSAFLFLAISLLCGSASVRAQEGTRLDGNWWISLSRLDSITCMMVRTAYIRGVADGGDVWHALILRYVRYADETYPVHTAGGLDRSFRFTNDTLAFSFVYREYFWDVSVTQVLDGLNDFYSDFRNRRILTTTALTYVLMGIHGEPEDSLRTTLERLRQDAVH